MGKIETRTLTVERSVAGVARSAQVGDSCFGCNRQMGSKEIKVLLPRYVRERDSGTGGRRFMCLSCYNRLRPLPAPRMAPKPNRIVRVGLMQATC